VPDQSLLDVPATEVDRDRFYLAKARSFVQENPGEALGLILKKQKALWGTHGNAVLDAADLILLPFLVLGFGIGIWDRKNWRYYYFIASPIISTVLVSSLFIGHVRFRVSAYPFFIAFAAIALDSLVRCVFGILRVRDTSAFAIAGMQAGSGGNSVGIL